MPEQLFSALKAYEPWQSLLKGLAKPGTPAALYDVTPSQRAFFACALAEQSGRAVLYIAPSPQAAMQAAEDASALLAGRAGHLPATELQFLRAVAGRETSYQRLQALNRARKGELKLLCCTADALLNRFMPAKWLEDASFVLREGEEHDPQELLRRLTAMGYERVPMVEGKGQCALLGDILNLYPPEMEQPVRVEFFDVQVDSIRGFDLLSQRSQARLPEVQVGPALEYFLPEQERAPAVQRMRDALARLPEGQTGQVKDYLERDLEQLLETGSFQDLPLYLNLLLPESSQLMDLLKDPLIVVDTPERCVERMEDRLQGFAEDLNLALARGDALPEQQGLLYTAQELLDRFQAFPLVTMQEFLRGMRGLEPKLVLQMKGEGLSRYQGRFQELSRDIKAWQKEGYSIAILCGGQSRAERMQRALQGFELQLPIREDAGELLSPGKAALFPIPFSRGFLLDDAKLVLLSDSDVFGAGRRRSRSRQQGGEKIEAFTDLSIGDYVVHEHHGIGIYQGTVRLQSQGTWRDYLFIQYRENDKLYVPLDQFDRVQKYIGTSDDAPKLNDLGSGDWEKQRKRVKAGLRKLAFDLVQLYAARQAEPGFAFPPQPAFESQFDDQFEYELTRDQQQAVHEVLEDMEQPQNMDRLLCGDVGYGKTEVALRAAFRAVINSRQVALLAPTTILVQQHFRTINQRFRDFPVTVDFVSRFRTPKQNRETIQKAARGEIDILVGTHRLLSKDVKLKRLGLLIVDEEQRFGVAHKESIKNLKRTVDVLTLSATPIPRTLHMSMLGVRDLSLLETPPEERFPVQTYVLDYNEALIRDAIMRECARQGQVFFLYNRVADIERFASGLRRLLPEIRIAVAHGQMPEGQLEDVMMDFYEGRQDLLLCTTIIENGIDIQRANTLIVYEANRFGLSQLYQLRGRVGRSNRAAYAYFTVKPDRALSETAEKRLAAIKEFTEFGSGFRIALRDLSIRGAGNILGPEQSGQVSAVGYDLYVKLIEEAVREAKGDFSQQKQSEMETRVELHVNAFLPEGYVSGEAQRMEIYKRIAAIRSEEDRSALLDELIDRFGEPSPPVLTLMDVALLRSLANSLGAQFVSFDRDALKLRLSEDFVEDPALLYKGMVATDRRFTMQAGKRPAMLLVLGEMEDQQALRLGLKALLKLRAFIDREKQEQASEQPE